MLALVNMNRSIMASFFVGTLTSYRRSHAGLQSKLFWQQVLLQKLWSDYRMFQWRGRVGVNLSAFRI